MKVDSNSRAFFIGLIVLSVLVNFLPFVNRPLLWVETFFHELAHGFAAVLTGGSIVDIQIAGNGSGLCRTIGGISFFVAFAGYFGAQLAGAFIYLAGSGRSKHFNQFFTFSMSVLIFMSMIFLASGITTYLIHLVLLAMFVLPLLKLQGKYLRIFIQFVGAFVIANSITSPIYQLGSLRSDAANLAQATYIPAIIWVILWVVTGLAIFLALYRSHRQ